MQWAAPEHAWLLLLALPMAVLLRSAGLRRSRALGAFTAEGVPLSSRSRVRTSLGHGLHAAAFLFLVAALCRPQWGQEEVPQTRRGVDILIALDVSRSMLADDQHPSRLEAARQAISGLLPRLRGDRIGLVAFAGSAFLVCPLTSDYATFAEMLAEVGPQTIPLGGTSLAGALAEARRAFGDRAQGGGVLVLITDGEDHDEDRDPATFLPGEGILLHAVATGTREGGLIPEGEGAFFKDREGGIVKTRPRTDRLQALAQARGGRLWELAAEPDALGALYDQGLAGLARHPIPGSGRQAEERFQFPLALAVLCFIAAPWVAGRGRA